MPDRTDGKARFRGDVADRNRRHTVAQHDAPYRVLTFFAENPIAAVIVACEIGLWVLLGLGMVLRYLVRLRRTSTAVLAGIPLLDVVLVIATAIDLHRGADVGLVHVLTGFYLGSSLAFGPGIVRWADVRFAHRFAGGPAPRPTPKHGAERVAHLTREWYRVVGTVAIASVVLAVLTVFFAAPEDEAGLWWWIGRAWVVVGLWFVFGPLWESGKKSATESEPQLVARVADDAELLGDLNRGGAPTGISGVDGPVDGEHLAHLSR
jgi:hypothetical protein